MLMSERSISARRYVMDYIYAWLCWRWYLGELTMTGQYTMEARNALVEERTSLETMTGSVYPRRGKLMLQDGTVFEGVSFGYAGATAGEGVFGTEIGRA